MRVLLATQPGFGHLFPLLPIAAAAQARGHDVAFACSASFRGEVEAAGFVAFACGRDWLSVEMARAFPEMTSVPPGPERYAWARATLFAGRCAEEAVPDLVALAGEWRPDVIVRDAADYGACLAAELLDLPHAVVRTDSGSSSYRDRHDVAEPLTELRARFGLPSDPNVDMPFRYLQLSFAPAGMDDPDDQAAPTCHRIRPIEPAAGDLDATPAWLADLPKRRTVYATLGTVYNSTDLLGIIIGALATEDLNVVVTVGRNQDPTRFGPQPAHVHIERWVPQQVLLPRCDAVVTHGGYGTVSAALSAGLPLVFMPISADQPRNAERCAALGVGRIVGPDDRTPEVVRATTRAVLDDHRHRLVAQEVAREAHRRPGVDHALDLLETLARERTPLVRARD